MGAYGKNCVVIGAFFEMNDFFFGGDGKSYGKRCNSSFYIPDIHFTWHVIILLQMPGINMMNQKRNGQTVNE